MRPPSKATPPSSATPRSGPGQSSPATPGAGPEWRRVDVTPTEIARAVKERGADALVAKVMNDLNPGFAPGRN